MTVTRRSGRSSAATTCNCFNTAFLERRCPRQLLMKTTSKVARMKVLLELEPIRLDEVTAIAGYVRHPRVVRHHRCG